MINDYAQKLAKVITEYSVEIQQGDWVVILGTIESAPLVEALVLEILRQGGHPTTQISLPHLGELGMRYSNEAQLRFLNPIQKMIYEKADVVLNIEAPTNTRALSNIDPKRLAIVQETGSPVLQTLIQRIGEESVRWCLMPYPTDAAAQQTEMGFHEYTEFLYRAGGLHHDDPVAYWRSVKAKQERLVDYLKDKSHFEIKGPGIDMTFEFGGRSWVSAHGNLNFPDGEFFTGPIENSVNGTVKFNMPTIYGGRELTGVYFKFVDGTIVEAGADKGEDFLLENLNIDDGARRLGEFAIGTNFGVDRVTGSTLLDEKIGGSIHMAIGNSLPQTGGVNVSRIHWDIVHSMKDGGEIYIDGELFYRSGEFMV